jgi:GTP:adenosylcobinamide-phosphate guanylyltransferase
MTEAPIDAVILAGSRPAGDPLAEAHEVSVKALVEVVGKPMLSHVAKTLIDHKAVGSIQILAQDIDIFRRARGTGWLTDQGCIKFTTSRSTIATSMEEMLTQDDARFPVLITTADNVLLDETMISHFVSNAKGSDIAIAVVEKQVLMAKYPASKRTWLKFRGGQYSGANLFYFGSAKAQRILRYWAEVEQDRKKGWKVLTIFGPWLLFLVLTRMINIDQLAERVGKKLGLKIQIVKMAQAEACIDVDKQSDLDLAEKILALR